MLGRSVPPSPWFGSISTLSLCVSAYITAVCLCLTCTTLDGLWGKTVASLSDLSFPAWFIMGSVATVDWAGLLFSQQLEKGR